MAFGCVRWKLVLASATIKTARSIKVWLIHCEIIKCVRLSYLLANLRFLASIWSTSRGNDSRMPRIWHPFEMCLNLDTNKTFHICFFCSSNLILNYFVCFFLSFFSFLIYEYIFFHCRIAFPPFCVVFYCIWTTFAVDCRKKKCIAVICLLTGLSISLIQNTIKPNTKHIICFYRMCCCRTF